MLYSIKILWPWWSNISINARYAHSSSNGNVIDDWNVSSGIFRADSGMQGNDLHTSTRLGAFDDSNSVLYLPHVQNISSRISRTLHCMNPAVLIALQFESMIENGTSASALPAIFVIIFF